MATLLALFARTFLLRPYQVPSISMAPTLLAGDHILVDRFRRGHGPIGKGLGRFLPPRPLERGDVVVFQSPESAAILAIKRCVGLPGERVEWHAGGLRIDGQALHEPYLSRESRWSGDPPLVVELGADEIFVLGDQRRRSHDSRHWGPLPLANVRGKAVLIYWSTEMVPLHLDEKGGWDRMAVSSKRRLAGTRWERLLVPIR